MSVFAAQVGLIDKDHPPQLDVRDTEFILHFLRTLNEHHQEQLRIQAAALDVKTSSKAKQLEILNLMWTFGIIFLLIS